MKRRYWTVGYPDLRTELQKRLTHPIAPTLTAELILEERPAQRLPTHTGLSHQSRGVTPLPSW